MHTSNLPSQSSYQQPNKLLGYYLLQGKNMTQLKARKSTIATKHSHQYECPHPAPQSQELQPIRAAECRQSQRESKSSSLAQFLP